MHHPSMLPTTRASGPQARLSGSDCSDSPNARNIKVIRLSGQDHEIRVTARHVRVAMALHAALSAAIYSIDDRAGAMGNSPDWEEAPFHHKLDLLELAHVALVAAGPGRDASETPDPFPLHRADDRELGV